MAYSFHKYWNPPTLETIQKYHDLRTRFNVPVWMGESGENTNEWFRDVVTLLEKNNIGWCWWTIKKIGSESSLMTISKPDGYQKIVDYWAGKSEKPDVSSAKNSLYKLTENAGIENCNVNYGVIRALTGKAFVK
jgi:hypothetical protein